MRIRKPGSMAKQTAGQGECRDLENWLGHCLIEFEQHGDCVVRGGNTPWPLGGMLMCVLQGGPMRGGESGRSDVLAQR